MFFETMIGVGFLVFIPSLLFIMNCHWG